MSDLISRADAIEAIASRDETDGTVKVFTGREVNEILSALQSADRQEVESATINNEGITFYYRKTGEWINKDGGLANCSICGERWGAWDVMNYCPNCGAKMKGGDD